MQLAANVPADKIAIISPYNSQVSLLASLIHPEYPEIEIGSVDGPLQACLPHQTRLTLPFRLPRTRARGRNHLARAVERRGTFLFAVPRPSLSLTYGPQGVVGFLSEQRRLNVAMTRARSQLVVVGDSETVAKGSKYLKAWMDWLENNAAVRMADTLE